MRHISYLKFLWQYINSSPLSLLDETMLYFQNICIIMKGIPYCLFFKNAGYEYFGLKNSYSLILRVFIQ